jgi:DNA (cytosine-5)-methyltransferase 1
MSRFVSATSPDRSGSKHKRLRVVDFFCGAGGMSYGLMKAGLTVLGGIDVDKTCEKTYSRNIRGGKYLRKDISTLSPATLAEFFGVEKADDRLVFAGCSPCQFWSKINTDRTKGLQTAFLLKNFERFIAAFLPGFVLVENVPGLLTRKRHSILPGFLSFLRENGYTWAEGIVNASSFGVPQHRRRYLLLATRVPGIVPSLPRERPSPVRTVRSCLATRPGLTALSAGQEDATDRLHRAARLSPTNILRLKGTPKDGGDRKSWSDTPLQLDAYEGKDEIFSDVYGRMFWDRPAPTITTRFNSLSNGRFGHPEQDRAITLREGAILQSFPKGFVFPALNQANIARQIGNAVPPRLAKTLGRHLITLSSNV